MNQVNCNNRACLLNLDGQCSADVDGCVPARLPLNLCPKYLQEGMSQDEFQKEYTIDVESFGLDGSLSSEDFQEYLVYLTKVRDIMHHKTLSPLPEWVEGRGKRGRSKSWQTTEMWYSVTIEREHDAT